MSGTALIALILISMGWLFYLLGLWLRLPILTGVVGSVSAFFSVPYLDPPWPWLWILLPLVLDPYWLRGGIKIAGRSAKSKKPRLP